MKLKYACAFLTICLFVGTLFISKDGKQLDTHTIGSYTVLTSCFPAYALTEAVIRDVPGLSLHMLTLPRQEGYDEYELSEWETAYAQSADIYVCFGMGYEGYDTSCLREDCIIITLLAKEDMYSKNEIMPTEADNNDAETDIYEIYLSVDGSKRLLAKLSEAFKNTDPQYAAIYAQNHTSAVTQLECIACQGSACRNAIIVYPCFAYMIKDAEIDDGLVLFSDDKTDRPEDATDLRDRMDNMLDYDETFSFDDYVNVLMDNYTLLYEAVK